MTSVQAPRIVAMAGKVSFNPKSHRYLIGGNLSRGDLLVWHNRVVGGLVSRCPSLVKTDAGPAEEALALLGDAVTVWSPVVLLGSGLEGLVKL